MRMDIMRVAGIVAIFGLMVVAAALSGPPLPLALVNLPILLFCTGVILGLGLVSFGYRDLAQTLSLLPRLLTQTGPLAGSERNAFVLRGLIAHAYAAGTLSALLSLFSVLLTLDDPAKLAVAASLCILSIIYAVVFGECVLRPSLYHLQQLLLPAHNAASWQNNDS